MNTMINPEPQPFRTREELLKHIEELEQKLEARNITLTMADESLKSYKRQIADTKESVEALAHEHLDLEGTEFYDGIVELFDIELTKYVTFQYTVSVEVSATVPAGLDDDEIMEELTNASLDYSFFGNGDFVIEGFDFGNMEVE
jgi:hypothetical protein